MAVTFSPFIVTLTFFKRWNSLVFAQNVLKFLYTSVVSVLRALEHIPSTAFVEKKARFLVSKGLSLVRSTPLLWGSDSPVRDELSTLNPLASMIRTSAGIRSPNLTSTTSPKTMSSARSVSFSPCLITVANWKQKGFVSPRLFFTFCKVQ